MYFGNVMMVCVASTKLPTNNNKNCQIIQSNIVDELSVRWRSIHLSHVHLMDFIWRASFVINATMLGVFVICPSIVQWSLFKVSSLILVFFFSKASSKIYFLSFHALFIMIAMNVVEIIFWSCDLKDLSIAYGWWPFCKFLKQLSF